MNSLTARHVFRISAKKREHVVYGNKPTLSTLNPGDLINTS